MDMDLLENEAKASAIKLVANMLQKSGHLEKVEQYKHRIARKKVSTEAMLKTAMQSQLDGITVGMNQLLLALRDITDIRKDLQEIQSTFEELPSLGIKLQDVKHKNMRHSQYVTAIENLKHLFTVPESVDKTKQWINEGKLLHAHQCLIDLETSRDDLLFEVYKLSNQSENDNILLKAYFDDVDALSQMMEKQLKLVLNRTLNIVRKEPTVIVTVLRIIEREEKSDTHALQRQKQTGFLPPGRPKRWREMAFAELEKVVSQKIEGNQVDERSSNKMWLVTYLELTRQLIIEDLRVVKTLCGPCFPLHYDIVNKFVNMYHKCLSVNLEQIIANGLEGNEYVSMLCWIQNTYFGPELMKHPDLNIDVNAVGPLLKSSVVNQLQQKYLEGMEANYNEWMRKTLETEKQDWNNRDLSPELGPDGCYQTAAPVIIFQMIDQNLQVAKTIGPDLMQKALSLSITQVMHYAKLYREAIIEMKRSHFEDRNRIPYYTHHMITILNNCVQMCELAEETKKHYWKTEAHGNPQAASYESITGAYQALRNEAAHYLLEEAFLDLDVHFQDLITPKWTGTSITVDTVCVTLEDYFQDYRHLKSKNFAYVIGRAEDLVAKKYISAMFQKKMTFRTLEERRQAASKIVREVEQLQLFFARINNVSRASDYSPLNAIAALTEVLKSDDLEILSLDLHTLVDKYPDLTEDHLSRLLALRGDMSRSEIREKVLFVKQTNQRKSTISLPNNVTIFKEIP